MKGSNVLLGAPKTCVAINLQIITLKSSGVWIIVIVNITPFVEGKMPIIYYR